MSSAICMYLCVGYAFRLVSLSVGLMSYLWVQKHTHSDVFMQRHTFQNKEKSGKHHGQLSDKEGSGRGSSIWRR